VVADTIGTMDSDHPYSALTPDLILDAVEGAGVVCDGRLLGLNSYENRVYQVGVEEAAPLIAKFYRPGRWSDEQILEEHAFAFELAQAEVPVVAPLAFGGRTLHAQSGFRFALYPRRGGRPPELEQPAVLERIGLFLGRLHAVGKATHFKSRPALDIASFGHEPREYLLDSGLLPPDLVEPYRAASALALENAAACISRAGNCAHLRLHADCHAGNILYTDEGPHFVDLDDARSGPAVQDLWMLLSGDRQSMGRQLGHALAGYEQFSEFDDRELHLIEALRTLRMLHYAAWLARRWDDPAFPAAFPWFNTQRYWQDHVLQIKEQLSAMNEAPVTPL
jgi:Ser/Thr protein kinase RdoA (MazF antagonist)